MEQPAGGQPRSETSDLIVAKVIAMSVLGIASFLLGIFPVRLGKLINIRTGDEDKHLVISLLLCFGGGVLLFTTFIHLQPEVREAFALLEERNQIPILSGGIDFSELVFCFGFFFVYLIEELVHLCLEKKFKEDALTRSLSVRCQKSKKDVSIPRVTLNKSDDTNISYNSYNSNKELYLPQANGPSNVATDSHQHSPMSDSMKNSFRGLLAVLALSFHAVFEGLAVGLENSIQNVWYLFAAIATHKMVIGFCLGIELVTSKTRLLYIMLYIGTFAIVTPLGIGAGIALSSTGRSQEDVTSTVLQGMAAGTLLYVVFFEVLSRERNNKHSGIWQLLAILAGFMTMLVLQIATGHSHAHNHTEDDFETTTAFLQSLVTTSTPA